MYDSALEALVFKTRGLPFHMQSERPKSSLEHKSACALKTAPPHLSLTPKLADLDSSSLCHSRSGYLIESNLFFSQRRLDLSYTSNVLTYR